MTVVSSCFFFKIRSSENGRTIFLFLCWQRGPQLQNDPHPHVHEFVYTINYLYAILNKDTVPKNPKEGATALVCSFFFPPTCFWGSSCPVLGYLVLSLL